MFGLLLAGWLGLMALAASAAEDDSDGPARFHSVKAWRGTFEARASTNESAVPARIPGTVSHNAVMRVEFVLTEFEDEPAVWTGRVIASNLESSYQARLESTARVESRFSTSGPMEFTDPWQAKLEFHRNRGWSFHIASARRKTEVTSVTTLPNGMTFRDQQSSNVYGLAGTKNAPYPAKGLLLQATGKSDPSPNAITSSSLISVNLPVSWDYTVQLEPTTLEELKLEIEEPAAYAKWRPDTTSRAEAGKPLEVSARVVTADGRKPQTRVESFEWVLEGTSREPGVTMNYPVAASDNRLDLELDATGEFFVLSPDKQKMQRAIRDGFSDTVKVVPFDWGGWSTLQVKATLADGRQLTGKLKGKKDEFGLRIPKRAPESHIADGWKQEKGASGADSADDDNAPVGDGTKGDGLTLYEEYRGFYENGAHICGDPKTKDFFIRLKQAGIALAGIGKFQRITKLKVHFEFSASEFPPTRVINLNHAQGARIGPQHGVIVQIDAKRSGSAIANGGPGNPKKITSVDLMSDVGTIQENRPGWVASTVAHELGHCVNLYHHGDTDPGKVVWYVDQGRLWELRPGAPKETEIFVLDEQFGDLTEELVKSISEYHKDLEARAAAQKPLAEVERAMLQAKSAVLVNLAGDQGQHSGFDNCVMRYDSAEAYVFRRQTNVRFWKFEEPIGHALCQSQAGSGVNQSGRLPQDRYGTAAHGRGNCVHQILVNDAVNPPNRGMTQHTK